MMRHGLVTATVSAVCMCTCCFADCVQAVSFVVGFGMQSLQVTFGILAASVGVVGLAALPGWGVYRRDSPQWACK